MTTDLLDFPPIEAPPLPVAKPAAPVAVVEPAAAPVAAVAPSIKDTVLAQFKGAEAGLLVLAEKYRAVAYDCKTTKGMAEAVAARADLRDNGRLALTKAEKIVKADVNDLKRVMADEVERLVAIVKPIEDAIDAQIQAEVQRKAAEKAERERVEAERVSAHRERLAKIPAYLTHCQQPGMTAARIEAGIAKLAAATFGPEWQEFAIQAADAQCKTLEAMRALHTQAVEREAEALRLEAQREEQARVAAQQAELQRQLDEAAEALRVQQEALAAQQAAATAAVISASLVNPPPEALSVPPTPLADPATLVLSDATISNPPFAAAPESAKTIEVESDSTGAAAPAAAAETLAECQAVLAEALALLDELICKPPTKKQSARLFAQVAALRARGGLPRA